MCVLCVCDWSVSCYLKVRFFQFLSLESISVLSDALSQIESQGNVSMNSTSSGSVVSSSVDTVGTSVYQTDSKLGETLTRDLCCCPPCTLACCLQKERWDLNCERRKQNEKPLQTSVYISY